MVLRRSKPGPFRFLPSPVPNWFSLAYFCTCVGIHPGQVEPASLIELITSRTEAL